MPERAERHQPRILMAAGEVSGDHHGAHLARAIRELNADAVLFGSGGEKMRQAGVDVRVETVHYGSVGIQESLRFVRPLRGVMHSLRRIVAAEKPDLAVLIDNEGFHSVLARFLHRQSVPFVCYFPPQVWLWGAWRARATAERAAAVIATFPAEAEIYRRCGARVAWHGHPLLDIVAPETDGRAAFRNLRLDPDAPTVGLLPGSRSQEVQRLGRPMLEAARLLAERHTGLQFILPLASSYLRAAVQRTIDEAGMTGRVAVLSEQRYDCLQRCSLLLTSSGTATLEAALLGVPMVVAYRVAPFTAFLARRLISVRFIAMPNILLDEAVVPELVQGEVTATRLAAEAEGILSDPAVADRMRQRLARIRPLLGPRGAVCHAASLILDEAARGVPASFWSPATVANTG